ncbi:hypothetical protein DL96DRAFT_1712413 [Flagelloscypha sp. PMI_526]|nr:hypothetical protein DL96DRAFT_1712413 [Flagelloscypha sp. PMI_526]
MVQLILPFGILAAFLVNGHLARSLQPQIHQQLASASYQNSGGELEQRQAASIIHALQAQLESERHIRRDLEERIALLEAMVGRRDVEIQQLISKPPEKRSDSSTLAQSLSGEDLSKLLDAQAKRNKDLEGEISALRIRLEKNPVTHTSRVRTSRPRLRETPSVQTPRTASFPRPVHAQTAPAIPYSAPLEKLKSLRQSSPKRISSALPQGKRRRPTSPPLAQLAFRYCPR